MRSTRRTAPWAALGVGVVLIVAAVLLWQGNVAAPTNAGQVPPAATAAAGAVPSPSARGRQVPPAAAGAVPSPSARGPATTPSARPAPPAASTVGTKAPTAGMKAPTAGTNAVTAAAPGGEPTRLALPTLGVTAGVGPVDNINGVLQVPPDISRVGWWRRSAPPGSAAGTTVLDGHIDSAADGEGALFHLGELNPGDTLTLTTTTGATVHYRVQARRVYVKAHGLPAELFTQQGPPRLVIISCGGPFDPTAHSYRDNIAVYATPT